MCVRNKARKRVRERDDEREGIYGEQCDSAPSVDDRVQATHVWRFAPPSFSFSFLEDEDS